MTEKKAAIASKAKQTTLIDASSRLSGSLHFNGYLQVDGKVKGSLSAAENSDATLYLTRHGHITGDIAVPNAIIDGNVTGNVYCSNKLTLGMNAKIFGQVQYCLIEIAEGASVDGDLNPAFHGDKSQTPALPRLAEIF